MSKTLLDAHLIWPHLEEVSHLQVLLSLCQQRRIHPYLVGGAVRDLLYKQVLSPDLDIVVPVSEAKTLAVTVAEKIRGKCICLDEQHQIYRVIVLATGEYLDIAGCVGDAIETDLHRRDFTVNAMAFDLLEHRLLDPLDGQKDLEQGLIRMVSEVNLLEDPLRLLRTFRIAADLGFTHFDEATLSVVKRHGHCVMRAAAERIHYELMRMLSVERCYSQVRLMADVGMLEHIFPELSAMHAIPPNFYHHLGLFDHTLELLRQSELHFEDMPHVIQQQLQEDFNPFTKRLALLRLACLFHDVGKPATMEYDAKTDRYRFYGHDAVSQQLVAAIGLRCKWGRDLTQSVGQLVRWHLYPGDLLKPNVTPKAYRRYWARVKDVLPEMILLAVADRYSAQGEGVTSEELENSKAGLVQLWKTFRDIEEKEIEQPKIISGQKLISVFKLSPGPKIGEIIRATQEAYINGDIATEEEAIAWVKTHFCESLSF